MTTAEKLIKLNEGVEQVAECNEQLTQILAGTDTGAKGYYDYFWEKFFTTSRSELASIVDGVAVVNGEYFFSGKGWEDDIFKPPYPIKATYGYGMFYASGISDTVIDVDFSKATYMTLAFSQSLIKHIKTVDLSNSAQCNRIFFYSRSIETIERIVFAEKNASYTECFSMCEKLKNITADGIITKSISFSDSPLLTEASIRSIINCLSKDVAGQSLTLSKTAVNNAFTTDEWNSLAATRNNWTISLV